MMQTRLSHNRSEPRPHTRREDGSDVSPSTFVAAKALRDASNRLPAQAITRVVASSQNPVWGQVLQVGPGPDLTCVLVSPGCAFLT